ncbi:hypothetical protein [Halegenticoccus tardaugens]|uniref:hypothetical protein n=1 Tax=Halegenticoccus tardaugens TaxID=2071624 RepID=UPI00100BAA38|nr:hypothetical protein [Halegenticoccus tardaugens]
MSDITRFARGQVPPNWVRAPTDGNAVRFRHRDVGVHLEAIEVGDAAEMPGSGRSHRWQLQCRQSAGEAMSVKPILRVSAKEEAVCVLYDWMELINATVESVDSDAGIPFGELTERLGAHEPPQDARTDARVAEL